MSKRKSIVSAFGDFASEPTTSKEVAGADRPEGKLKPSRVAAGIIGTTQRTLTQIREERDALLEQASQANQIIQIDAGLMDPSPFRDRLPDDSHDGFEAFKESISAEGQKVPVTVRRHPTENDRYQVVYGHRRWKALGELGLKVNAIIADYDDRDLVIAQGIENANRQDLSWIERALFANEMSAAGIRPRDIKAALGIDDAELSKLRSVLKEIPQQLIERIGRAPSIGRPRWQELASVYSNKSTAAKINKTLSADKVLRMPSDERFLLALSFVGKAAERKTASSLQSSMDLGDVGSMTVTAKSVKVNMDPKHSKAFSKFLEAEMEALVERYMKGLETK